MPLTWDDLADATFEYAAHYNMGRLGYGYGYRCAREPRLSFIDRVYKPTRERPDGAVLRQWYVDGEKVGEETREPRCPDAALAALARPPALTDDEKRVLALVPDAWEPLRRVEDDLAGVARPGGGIMPETPHSRVLWLLRGLASKGMIEHGRTPERGDGEPWSESVPAHARWSPTVRKRPGAVFT